MAHLTRGALAEKAGVNLETIRYYEQRGLLPDPPRSRANYRLYPDEAVRRLRFIRRAQELGFTLKEIKELLSMRARPRARCADVLQQAERKIRDIDEKVRSLRSMRRALTRLTAECGGAAPISECPILESLDAQKG